MTTFADFAVGQSWTSAETRVTPEQVAGFATLVGLPDDAVGHRDLPADAAPGLLLTGIAMGRLASIDALARAPITLVRSNLRYRLPVCVGDRVRVRADVRRVRALPEGDGSGLVTFGVALLRGPDVTQDGEWSFVVGGPA